MDNRYSSNLNGMNPADLLSRGTEHDTLIDESSSPLFTPLPPEKLAEAFPRFEILELIGIGGMGAVYKARQRELDRVVALKILPREISSDPDFTGQFEREAKALAKLNHPGIVSIYEFGHAQDLYYIVMEYVEGASLRRLMENGRINPGEALAIIPQICDVLQFAHDRGIIHRDIKPENILLDKEGQIKVADFGLAKRVKDRQVPPANSAQETLFIKNGKVMGTPAYMAPEQFIHPADIDNRIDIYALGVVFYQMLTGELPGNPTIAPSRKVRINTKLDQVVLKALEKDPERRYAQANELKTNVKRIKADKTSRKTMLVLAGILVGILIAAFLLNIKKNQSGDSFEFPVKIPDGLELIDSRLTAQSDLHGFERKTGGKIERIGKFIFTLDDHMVQINVIDAVDEKNARIIYETLINKYGKPYPYTLLKDKLVFEYDGQDHNLNRELVLKATQLLGFSGTDAGIEPAGLPPSQEEGEVLAWLSLNDKGKYKESYMKFAPIVKSIVTVDNWNEKMQALRTPLGEPLSRKLKNHEALKSIPGMPDGEYRIFQYETELLNKKNSNEIITIAKEPDGRWSVAGYYIR